MGGASKGLGYAVALELALEGARVSICGRNRDRIESAAGSIAAETGAQVQAVEADLSTAAGAELFIRESERAFGTIQVLVTNTGGPSPGDAESLTDEQWVEALELNFFSAVRLVRKALPGMKERPWGRIVGITSTSVKQPIVNLALSSAVRSATTSFLKMIASGVGANSITANSVLPGHILTDRLRELVGAPIDSDSDHQVFGELAAQSPSGRIGSPHEFAAVVAFLCSERASFVNGVALQVDGGLVRSLL